MQLVDGALVFSPSDLNGFVACEHLTALELAVARGELRRPEEEDPQTALVKRKGDAHEAAYLASLRAAGRRVVAIPADWGDWAAGARATKEAMKAGAEVIYQAVLLGDDWRGLADFLERVEEPSELGSWSYEALDAKLARRPRPEHLLQLAFYSEAVGRIQGREPQAMHVVVGTGERESFRPDDFAAYHRRVRGRFLAAVTDRRATYPWPVAHCELCAFRPLCEERWDADDHLVRVAGIRRDQVKRLQAASIGRLEELAQAPRDSVVTRMRSATFEKLRHQAELQLGHRRTGAHRFDLLPREANRGLAILPPPSPGDLFFDIEGDPFYAPDRGLEYLFGVVSLERDGPQFRAFWGLDRDGERRAFEDFVDFVVERRRRFPDLHVYHYAHYETTVLKRLMGAFVSREDEVDDLLRGHVFVDLYRVVRQALRSSHPGYGLKRIEGFYLEEREADVAEGGESVVRFEEWLEGREQRLLDEIEAYNREDCLSTLGLREWLLSLRPADVAWPKPLDPRAVSDEVAIARGERERLRDELLVGADEGELRWLAAHLLDYHRREAKPAWWAHYRRLELSDEELLEDGDAIGCIEPQPGFEPEPDGRSLVYALTFPPQEHKVGERALDPRDPERSPGSIVSVDDVAGVICLRRAADRAAEPLPTALVPDKPVPDTVKRRALMRFGRSLAAGSTEYPALESVLARAPRVSVEADPIAAALALDGEHLFVQGPPGSGKTWLGGRMAVALMQAGYRVGVASTSHRAIGNFLRSVEDAAETAGYEFRGLKKSTGYEGSVFEGTWIESSGDNAAFADPELQLIAGTAWLFAREELERSVNTLFVDEAGQVALADALALGTAAHNLVFLGDPNQLAHVSQGLHPAGTDTSVLAHLLGEDETVPPERGLFLEETWRLRPEVCEYVSDAFYEGRLRSADACFERSLAAGNGIRFLSVEHEANRGQSFEEADVVAAEVARLAGSPFTDGGRQRPLRRDEILVVTPYNAQVRALRTRLPDEVRVGTVDKFQGQEAPVVIFSMATSSGEDVPRNLGFLLSRNRLNVAVSRAQCLAVLVCSPRLLEARARTIEEMRLVNALCRLVEIAEEQVR